MFHGTIVGMRTLRIIAVALTALCTTLSPFFHVVGIGALLGAILCVWLWRYLLLDWARAFWHALVDDLRKGP